MDLFFFIVIGAASIGSFALSLYQVLRRPQQSIVYVIPEPSPKRTYHPALQVVIAAAIILLPLLAVIIVMVY